MKLKIIKSSNTSESELLEISTEQSRIIVGFGEEVGTCEKLGKDNVMYEGVTSGNAFCDGVFILRNPENCSIVNYTLEEVPVFLERKIKASYEIYSDFYKLKKIKNVKEMRSGDPINIKDLEITYFLVDPSNPNTSLLLVKSKDKSVLVSGDFRSYDEYYETDKFNVYLNLISKVDYWFIEGKYFGKTNNSTENNIYDKLKNIMKYYKQVFVIQSESDMMLATKMYEVARKTKKIFIENTLLANLTSEANGSAPNPVRTKEVYAYTPLMLDNENFEFKKKYVTHFYIYNANNKMKKGKYLMNINRTMFQDIQVFIKEKLVYDACVIFAMNRNFLKIDKELEEFVNMLKDFDIDYYEIYSFGKINESLINKMLDKFSPKAFIPINFDKSIKYSKFRIMGDNEIIEY